MIRFGRFEYDPGAGDLQRDGRAVRLPPQPLRVLGILLARPGELVTRDEIQEQIWPDEPSRVTRDQGLNACVAQIRGALGERASQPIFIETHPKRGYRFIAPVEVVPGTRPAPEAAWPEPRMAAGTRFRSRPAWVTVAAGIAIVTTVTMVAAVSARRAVSADPIRSPERVEPTGEAARTDYVTAERLLRQQTIEAVLRSLPYLQRVVALEPSFAPGHMRYAAALLRTGDRDAAEEHALTALELDHTLPDAYRILADIRLDRDFDWVGAERLYRKAIDIGAGRHEFPHAYAHFLVSRGETDSALTWLDRARTLHPLSGVVESDMGWIEYWAGRYDDAARRCREAVPLLSSEIRTRAERCALHALIALGRIDEARPHALAVMRAGEATAEEVARVASEPAERKLTAYFEWAAQPRNWRVALGSTSELARARAAADLGRREEALRLLERAFETRPRGLTTIAVEPRFAPLRTHPRFNELLARIGL